MAIEPKAISQLDLQIEANDTDVLALETGQTGTSIGVLKQINLNLVKAYLLNDKRFTTPEVIGTAYRRIGKSDYCTGIVQSIENVGTGQFVINLTRDIRPMDVHVMGTCGWLGYVTCDLYDGKDQDLQVHSFTIQTSNDASRDDVPFRLTIIRTNYI